jgi:septin family protein
MIGFELIAQNLERNFLANKLHHGIIIAGKKGIGKASFIKQFCQKILQANGEANADYRIVEKIDEAKNQQNDMQSDMQNGIQNGRQNGRQNGNKTPVQNDEHTSDPLDTDCTPHVRRLAWRMLHES